MSAILRMLRDNPVVQAIFEEYGVEPDRIDEIPVEFAKIRSSAKTKNGKVYLNEKLLDDGDFIQDIHYIVHEAVHWLQQTTGSLEGRDLDDDVDYLDTPAEVEAFRNQIRFMKQFYGDKYANRYVDDLLDFHELDGRERAEKRSQLIG